MSFVRLAFFPDSTRQQYDALAAALPPGPVPRGRLLFAAGPVRGGWQVVQVWSSRELLEDFNRAVFRPALDRAGSAGLSTTPVVTDFEPVALSLGDP